MYISLWENSRGHPDNDSFMQFSTKIDGFEQKYSQGFENSYNSHEQYPLEKFFIFTIYQNYTLALSILLMHRKITGCMAVHFTDAQKIYWIPGCRSLRIVRVHVLPGANSWSVKKSPCFLANQIAGILRPIYKLHWLFHTLNLTFTLSHPIGVTQENFHEMEWDMGYLVTVTGSVWQLRVYTAVMGSMWC